MSESMILGERLVNLCPHDVRIIRNDGVEVVFPRPQRPARIITVAAEQEGIIDGVPIIGPATYDKIVDLPEPTKGTFFIVSQILALSSTVLENRNDIVYPGAAKDNHPIRLHDGKLHAVSCLVRAK